MSDGLSVFQYDLLSVLHQYGPMKGLAVKSLLEETRDRYDGDVNHGRLYPNLNRLVDKGLVEKGERDKRTNEYALSDDGGDVLDARVRELAGEPNE